MNARKTQEEIAVRHPRETPELFGHREAETALLSAYRGGRIPHAWLIGGAQGIGKATLAYRMARFVLANRRAKLVIIDECSMVGAELGRDLLSFGVPVLVLGDPAQLPPVEDAGFFTNGQPDIMLSEVHRQAADNPIIRLSMDVREAVVFRQVPSDLARFFRARSCPRTPCSTRTRFWSE